MLRNRKHKRILAAICAVVAVVFAASAILVHVAQLEPVYAVKAGGEELFKVEDKATAEQVIEEVMDEYTPEGAPVGLCRAKRQTYTPMPKSRQMATRSAL